MAENEWLDSDLNDAGTFQLIPNGMYNAHVVEVITKKDGKTLASKAGAPMVNLTWEIDEGDFAGRKIRFNNIMLGGLTAEGKPMPLGQLCAFIQHTGVPWKCKHCGTLHESRDSFYLGTKEDKESGTGLKVGNYYCSACKNPSPGILHNPTSYMSARCAVRVGSKKQEGTDKEFNEVQAYGDLIS